MDGFDFGSTDIGLPDGFEPNDHFDTPGYDPLLSFQTNKLLNPFLDSPVFAIDRRANKILNPYREMDMDRRMSKLLQPHLSHGGRRRSGSYTSYGAKYPGRAVSPSITTFLQAAQSTNMVIIQGKPISPSETPVFRNKVIIQGKPVS